MIYVVAALVLGAVTVFNVKTVLEANHVYDLTMTSIDALSENSDGESGESGGSTGDGESDTGANITDERECHNKNGYWNMALICTDSGIEKLTCERTGNLRFGDLLFLKFLIRKEKNMNLHGNVGHVQLVQEIAAYLINRDLGLDNRIYV